MKVAYFCVPHVGGTWTRFLRLRPALADSGIDFRAIHVSSPGYVVSALGLPDGAEIWSAPASPADATAQTVRRLDSEGFGACISMPLGLSLYDNLIRYVPAGIRTIALLPGSAPSLFSRTKAIAPWCDAIVCVNQFSVDELLRKGVPPAQLHLVWNGVESRPAAEDGAAGIPGAELRVMFVGRLSDHDKGVRLLPRILHRADDDGVRIHLTLAGDGPDAGLLRRLFEQLGVAGRVSFLGRVHADAVLEELREQHCLLMPSRTEGCPWALLEAMSRGVVPVVSRLKGSLSTIVRDRVSGLTARPGSASEFSGCLAALQREPGLQARLSAGARRRVDEEFRLDQMARAYERLLVDPTRAGSRPAPPLPLDRYRLPRALRPRWWTVLPPSVRRLGRTILARLGRAS